MTTDQFIAVCVGFGFALLFIGIYYYRNNINSKRIKEHKKNGDIEEHVDI